MPEPTMITTLGRMVQDHHAGLMKAQQRLDEFRDQKIELNRNLSIIGRQIAEAERAVESHRELLAMSWDHYRTEASRAPVSDPDALTVTCEPSGDPS